MNVFHSRTDRADVLPILRCPVLCISGEYDSAPGLAKTEAQAKSAQDGRFIVVPGSGHYVPMERAAELNIILSALIHELP